MHVFSVFFHEGTKIGFFDEYRYLCEDVNIVIVKNIMYKRLVLALFVAVFSLSGCKDIRDITVISFAVESIAPRGFQGVDVYVAVGVDNPAFQVGLEDIEGALKHSGKVLGRMAVDPFVLQGKSAEIYHLKATLTLGEDATLKDLLMLTDMVRLNECMVDVSLKARLKNGVAAPVNIKDIPLKKLLEN